MMRRIEGSVCGAPIDGMGINLMRWARSAGPAPRPMINLSNNADSAGGNACSRRAAESRSPLTKRRYGREGTRSETTLRPAQFKIKATRRGVVSHYGERTPWEAA